MKHIIWPDRVVVTHNSLARLYRNTSFPKSLPSSGIALPDGKVLYPLVDNRPDQNSQVVTLTGYTLQDGVVAAEYATEDLPVEDDTAYRKRLFNKMLSDIDKYAQDIIGQYAESERLSWSIQREQAQKLLDGGTLPAGSLIYSLAEDAGETAMDYASSVIENATAFEAKVAKIISARREAQRVLDRRTNAQDIFENFKI